MKYGLLTYQENKWRFNIGDYIQSLAAIKYLPNVDVFINREKLAEYKGEKIKLIMNGWFTHNIYNWVPSEDIIPLFVSFHLNSSAAPYLLNDKAISYLKKHEPIGCRDYFTVNLLKEKGIGAYFSGCLTLTLDKYKVEDKERGNIIYIADPLYNYPSLPGMLTSLREVIRYVQNGKIFDLGKRLNNLKKIIDPELLNSAIYIKQEFPSGIYSDQDKFSFAEKLLNHYARAKLVITSRIHCALPCLALGTPVVFINGFDNILDTCRFDGLLNLFNRIDIDSSTGEWISNFPLNGRISENTIIENPGRHSLIQEFLVSKCTEFIEEYENSVYS